MESKAALLQLLDKYLQNYPAEVQRLSSFRHFVNEHEGRHLYSRSNCTGHLTASAFIISPGEQTLLLLQHKALNRWLQPGGHIDETDSSLLSAAQREATEETGIPTANLLQAGEGIFDIDSHFIPANAKKNEPAHYHHDVRFLFICRQVQPIILAASESSQSRWLPWAALVTDGEFGEVVRKIERLF